MKRLFFFLSVALALVSCNKDNGSSGSNGNNDSPDTGFSESDLLGVWATMEVAYAESQVLDTDATITLEFKSDHKLDFRSNNNLSKCEWTLDGDRLEITGETNQSFLVKELDDIHAALFINIGQVNERCLILTKVSRILPGVWKGLQLGFDDYSINIDASGSSAWTRNGVVDSFDWVLDFDEGKHQVFISFTGSSDNKRYKVYYLDEDLLLCKDRNNAEFRFVRETPAPWTAFKEKDLLGVWICARDIRLYDFNLYPSVNPECSLLFTPDHKVAYREGATLNEYPWSLEGDKLALQGRGASASLKELDGRRMIWNLDYEDRNVYHNTFVNLSAILPGKWKDVDASGEGAFSCMEFKDDGTAVFTDANSGEELDINWSLGFVEDNARVRLVLLGSTFSSTAVIKGVVSDNILLISIISDNKEVRLIKL